MDADERLRLDYEQTTELYRTLLDVRFKLLAIVPTISGVAVGLLDKPRPAIELLAVGLLGLVATLGVFVYELRNTQIHDAVVHRAKELERRLGFPSGLPGVDSGGLFTQRSVRSVRLFGLVGVVHDRGLGLVYGAALAGWSYLVGWGALKALDVGEARKAGGAIAVVVGLLALAEVERIDRRGDKAGATGSSRARESA
ncbi:MAG: hypothetical protein ACXVY8_05270 [Gaiellaceae bacterium]